MNLHTLNLFLISPNIEINENSRNRDGSNEPNNQDVCMRQAYFAVQHSYWLDSPPNGMR